MVSDQLQVSTWCPRSVTSSNSVLGAQGQRLAPSQCLVVKLSDNPILSQLKPVLVVQLQFSAWWPKSVGL